MAKAKIFNTSDGGKSVHIICPGCGSRHAFKLDVPQDNGAIWTFNGDVNRPTFNPSMLVTCGHYVEGEPQPPNCEHCNEGHICCYRCHSFVTDGKIQFLTDSTHNLTGQTVELPDIE